MRRETRIAARVVALTGCIAFGAAAFGSHPVTNTKTVTNEVPHAVYYTVPASAPGTSSANPLPASCARLPGLYDKLSADMNPIAESQSQLASASASVARSPAGSPAALAASEEVRAIRDRLGPVYYDFIFDQAELNRTLDKCKKDSGN